MVRIGEIEIPGAPEADVDRTNLVWGACPPHHFYEWENLMVEVLSEVNWGKVVEPVTKVFTKKKEEPKFLEEQIRDHYPCDVEPKEEDK